MGDVIPLGGRHASLLYHQRGKTLLIERDKDGDYVVRMSPAYTDVERALTSRYASLNEARAVAWHAHRTYPDLFTVIVDKTLPDLGGAA